MSLFSIFLYCSHASALTLISEMCVFGGSFVSSTFRVKNEIGDGLLRRKRASGEGSRHSRYAISGLLCPNFCVHLSAHPFANPGIPPARTTTITIGIPCHRLSFLKLASLTKPFSSYSLPLFRFLFPFAISLFLLILLSQAPFRTEMPLFLLTASQKFQVRLQFRRTSLSSFSENNERLIIK